MKWFYPLIHTLWFRVVVGILCLYALCGFVGVPYLIRHFAPPEASRMIQRPLSLGEISFNPFLFRLDAHDTVLTEADGKPVFALKRLLVDFELLLTIFNRAPTLAEVRLEGPLVNLVQDKNGVLNMAKIAASLPPDDPAAEKPPEDAPLPSLILKRIVLADGEVDFENQALEPPVINRAEHLDLELRNISTLPERHGLYHVDAGLPEGGTLRWEGDVSLNPMRSTGSLSLEGLKVLALWRLVQDRVQLAEPSGDINLAAHYQFSRDKTNTQVTVDDAVFRLAGLKLATAEKQVPLAELEEFRVDKTHVDLAQQTVDIPDIVLRKGKLSAVFDAAGELNWLTLMRPAATPVAPPPPASSASPVAGSNPSPAASVAPQAAPVLPWTVNLGQFSLSELVVEYSDERAPSLAKAAIGDIGLNFKANAKAGGTDEPVVHVADLGLRLHGIRLNQDKSSLLVLDDIALEQATADLPEQRVNIPRLVIGKGEVNAGMDTAGQLNWLRLVPPDSPPSPDTRTITPATAAAAPAARPWSVDLGQFNLNDLALNYAAGDAKNPIKATIGNLGVALKANAVAGGAEPPVIHLGDLGVHLKQISVNQQKKSLLNLDDIGLEKASLDLPAQTLRIPLIGISKGHVGAAMDARGQLDWQALAPPAPPATAKTPAPAPVATQKGAEAKPWQVSVDQFKLSGLGMDFSDASHNAPITLSLGDFGLNLKADAVAGSGPVKAHVNNIDLHFDRVAVSETQSTQPLLKWDSLKVEQGQVDLEKQNAAIRRISLKGGGTGISRDAKGAIYPISLFDSGATPEPEPRTTSGKKAPPVAEKPWAFSLGELAVNDFGIGVKDRSQGTELAYDLDNLAVSVKNVSSSGKTPVNFNVKTRIRQGGALALIGTAAPTGANAKSSIKLDHFNLNQLQPFLNDYVALTLQGANLSTDLSLDFRQAKPAPQIKVTGDAGLANLVLTQSKDGKKFLSWKNLATKGIDFCLAPDKLTIKEVKLVEPDSVVAIHKDKTTNVSDIIKKPKPAAANASVPAKPAAPATKASPAFPVTIARILVEKGTVDFSDDSLIFPFATRIHDFGGSISGFGMSPQSRATLQLAGRVDEYGEAKVDGSLTPVNIKQFSDISVIFRNVTMSSLSPYSATFAGRKIDSGKLNLDLQYKIEESKLKSQNKITLEQFKLGETVNSPNATSLPLDLAVALLTDSEGKIQASVPIEGSMDDPKFALGGVIWDAFTTMITNVVKAPFNALASLVGSDGGADAGKVAFDAGQSVLPPPEREKLQKIAATLAGRANLKLTVHGGVDPEVDMQALKSLAIRQAVANQLDVTLAPGELPDTVNVTDLASQRALEKLAAESGGADGLASTYEKEKGHPAQRVGAMSGLFGKPSETPDFYEKLLAFLVEHAPLGAGDLDALADRRAKAVQTELLERQRLDRSRLTLGKPSPATETSDKRVAIELELGMN